MKNTINKISILLVLLCFGLIANAQNSSINNVSLKTDLTKFKVMAQGDTTYDKYVEIVLNDTLISNVRIKLTELISGVQSTIKDTTYLANTISYSLDMPDLILYKTSSLIWRVDLGEFSLLDRHGIVVQVQGIKPNDGIYFEDEF